jgi:hypothetical protein
MADLALDIDCKFSPGNIDISNLFLKTAEIVAAGPGTKEGNMNRYQVLEPVPTINYIVSRSVC